MKSGFVALIGASNVGKSTLVNRLVGSKVAITSPRIQTTRDQIQGIFTDATHQIVFVDTPGVHRSQHLLGRRMRRIPFQALDDVEAVIYLIDATDPAEIPELITRLKDQEAPVVVVFNKIDLIAKEQLLPLIDRYRRIFPGSQIVPISALNGDNCPELLEVLRSYMVEGPLYYPPEVKCNRDLAFQIKELIRESAIARLNFEVPHSIAVVINAIEEHRRLVYVSADIICERDGQKQILIGKGGLMIKEIGRVSRIKIADILHRKVDIELFVKVIKDWRNKEGTLQDFGYGQ